MVRLRSTAGASWSVSAITKEQQGREVSLGIWLIFPRKETGKRSLGYEESVEEGLCFGWMDSIIERINEEKNRALLRFVVFIPLVAWRPELRSGLAWV